MRIQLLPGETLPILTRETPSALVALRHTHPEDAIKELTETEQSILRLMSEGLRDHEVCRRLQISRRRFDNALKRIEERAQSESDDAGRFYEQALRRRSERLVVALTARITALMDALPQAVLVVDGRTGAVKEFNQQACDLFGYAPKQLRRVSVEALIPEAQRAIHPAYRVGFLASVRKREMGYHPPIQGVCRDGSEVELAIALTATVADDDVMVVCEKRTTREADRAALTARGESNA